MIAASGSQLSSSTVAIFEVAGRNVEWVDKFKYLGTLLTPTLNDHCDIENQRANFIRSANYVLSAFAIAPADVKSGLIQTYSIAPQCMAHNLGN